MHEQALALAQEIGDRAAEAFDLGNLGVHASELGDHEQAIARFEASWRSPARWAIRAPVVLSLHNLAHRGLAARSDSAGHAEAGGGAGGGPRASHGLDSAHHPRWTRHHQHGPGRPRSSVGYFRESIALAQVRGNLGDVIDGVGGLGGWPPRPASQRRRSVCSGRRMRCARGSRCRSRRPR